MSDQDPSTPSRKVGDELNRSRKRSADTTKILSDLDAVFAPVRDIGTRNHIAWKLKQVLGPATTTYSSGDSR